MKYTISQFRKDFPNNDACLDYILSNRYGNHPICPKCGKQSFHKVSNRKCYACAWCGYQIHPTAGTIFHKSSTSLTNWFFAIYLMSNSKNGVSAKELERHLGITYKTAWRIAKKIRELMSKSPSMLGGTIEVDEAYLGGKKSNRHKGKKDVPKTPIVGLASRKGKAIAKVVKEVETRTLINMIRDNVKIGSTIMSDEARIYPKIKKYGYGHKTINHSKGEYVRDDVYANSLEGFWSQLKRSINGTYHSVSVKHLQSYVDECSYHYNHRFSYNPVFQLLLSRLCELPDLGLSKSVSFVVRV